MNYESWTTRDGRTIPVREMDAHHLIHTILALEEGRLFEDNPKEAFKWMMVLKGEAVRRDLDWDEPATTKVSLIDHVLNRVSFFEGDHDGALDNMMRESVKRVVAQVLEEDGIDPPQIDVSNLDGSVTYLHWQEGGTPLDRAA